MAQKYQVSTALTRIRDCASRREPRLEFICSETTLKEYSLAWKYGLLEEALLAAENTLKWPMTLHVFEDKLNVMPRAALVELWSYRRRVLDDLNSSLAAEFFGTISDVYKIAGCSEMNESTNIPLWLSDYLDSVVKDPACLDITTFHLTLSSHIFKRNSYNCCTSCRSITGETIRAFWAALTAVFQTCIKRVSSTTLNDCMTNLISFTG